MKYLTKQLYYTLLAGITLLGYNIQAKTDIVTKKIDAQTQEIALTLAIESSDFIDKNSIMLSVDHPNIEISAWQANRESVKHFDPTCKETRKVYEGPVTLQFTAKTLHEQSFNNAHIHISYYQDTKKGMIHETFPLSIQQKTAQEISTAIAIDNTIEQVTAPSMPLPSKEVAKAVPASWSARLSSLVETTESTAVRIILVLLLGLLMSLTPCIYPMIPITVGILQAQGSKSLGSNLLLATAYTFGIATTFAALGVTAAYTGALFGSLMSNPVFILTVVAVLAYLGFSMLGFYDMYTPKFMRNAVAGKGGSLTSAFLFGAASGTVASPCLSPGLILLLSIVATLGNKLLGFVLLFSFGIGLSLPLLLIGTFSTSLMMLPRAGMWMVEVKKIFGLLLFAMCFYFLNNIIPWYALTALMAATMCVIGIFYLRSITPYDSRGWRTIKNVSGIALIASSLNMCMQSYQSLYASNSDNRASVWSDDYYAAREQAREQHKQLFVDIGASYCSICKAIDRTILSNPRVVEALEKKVAVKINAAEKPELVEELQKQYTIKGVPTILLVDSSSGKVIRQWGGELYDLAVEEFLQQLA